MNLAEEVQNFLEEKFPVVSKFGRKEEIMEGVKKQAEIAADLGEKNTDTSCIPSNEITKYLNASGMYNRSNKDHKNFKLLEDSLVEELHAKVNVLCKVLKAGGCNYFELVRKTFSHRDNAKNLLLKEYVIRKKQIQLIKEDSKLFSIPFFAREMVLEIIEAAFLKEKELFEKKIFESWKDT